MSEERQSEEASNKAPTRVWMVEDNETLRRTVARVLDRQKDMKCVHQYERCEDAIEALVAGERPDVMLFDIGLPGMSGIEGIRRIKTALPEIEILVFSVSTTTKRSSTRSARGPRVIFSRRRAWARFRMRSARFSPVGRRSTPSLPDRVLDMFSDLAPQSRDYGLTEREKEVLEQMVEGLTKKEIADQLDLSFHTVDKHIRGIYSKLHVNTMTGAVAKALKEGLLPKT
jgi:DNA-binding NarL/FixJ family response regulator